MNPAAVELRRASSDAAERETITLLLHKNTYIYLQSDYDIFAVIINLPNTTTLMD
jgi:hypothetical protein